jgi:hypothetical protein
MGSARPFAYLASLALLALSLVALLPDCAFACSCALPPGSPEERAREASSSSTAVFSAEAVDVEESPPTTTMIEGTMAFIMGEDTATVFLRVSEVWKGPRRQTVVVDAAADSGSGCGYPFEEGREYLVYATEEDPSVTLCSETKPLSEADADLGALGDGEAPEDAGALSDTSGGVSAGAMVALAGLAVTGSFLLAVRLLRVR